MKSKREVLETIIEETGCSKIDCKDCPYSVKQCEYMKPLRDKLMRIGAMAILRQNRKKRKFDPSKVLTVVTADQAKVGMKGYFADSLEYLKKEFAINHSYTLCNILNESCCERFMDSTEYITWSLFYPIDEEVK